MINQSFEVSASLRSMSVAVGLFLLLTLIIERGRIFIFQFSEILLYFFSSFLDFLVLQG